MRFTTNWCSLVVVLALIASTSVYGQVAAVPIPDGKTILFVCEHGAAKSVIATAYFDKLAKERGLRYRATFRGTNPDPALAAAAVAGLKADGIDTRGWKPQQVTREDLDAASRVVTMGCEVPGKEAAAGKLMEWNEISSPSQNYAVARDEIMKRVESLIDELARQDQGTEKSRKRP